MSENDIVSRLILDDSDFIKKMESINPVIDKVANNFDDLQKDVKASSMAIGKDLVEANNKATKSIENATKATIKDSKALEKQKKDIADVSMLIAKNSEQSNKLVGVYKKLIDARDKGILLDPQDIKELADGFDKFAKEVGLSQDQLNLLQLNLEEVVTNIKAVNSDEFKELASQSEQVTTKFVSAKSELRQLTNLINSGQLTGDELVQARTRAAQLTDEIGDTREQLKNLASDTRGLDTLIEGTRLVAAGFSIAEGASALFGEENKDVQEALIKLNAVMALSNGLQEVHALLLQNSNLRMRAAAISQGIYSTVVGTSTGALKLFRIALASTGIGLLVIGLGALVANWDKVKNSVNENSKAIFDFSKRITVLFPPLNLLIKGIEFLYNNFDRLDNFAKGAFKGLVDGFGQVGNVLGKLFDLDFSGAYDEAKKIGQVIANGTAEGIKEADFQDANKALAKQIDDTVKSQKKRVEVLEAGGKETSRIQKNILENELKSLQLAGADKQAIEDKQHEIAVFNAARAKKLKEDAAKEDERIAKLKKEASDKLKGIQQELFDSLSEFGILSEQEQFDIIKANNIKALEDFKVQLKEVANVLNQDVSKELSNVDKLIKKVNESKFVKFEFFNDSENDDFNIEQLLKGVEKRRTIQLQEIEASILSDEAKEELKTEILLRGELERLNILQEFGQKGSLEYEKNLLRILEINNKLNPDPIVIPEPETGGFLSGISNFEDLLQKSLDSIFGPEGGEKAREFLKGVASLVGEFGNILNEASDLQIEAIDKQLDSLSERREKAQEELDQELEFQKEGLANNVGNKEQEVNGLLAEEQRLTAERERITQEANRRQLIADTVTQAQSLITSSINIIKGFSNIPIIGLPLGIAAVGTLLGFFAKSKADAFKATRLYKGANRIDDHFGEVGHRSDIPGRGEGYRVVDAVTGQDTNVRISGREMLLPEDITQSQSKFFKNLKAGRYNFDIAEVLDLHSSLGRSVKEKAVHNTIINNTAVQPSKQWVSYTNKKGEVKAVLLDIPTNGDKQTYIFKD
jgi:hypothetical protein